MERKKKQIENTKQKTKKKQIENTKQKNKKKLLQSGIEPGSTAQ